jgi:hypothetical protein
MTYKRNGLIPTSVGLFSFIKVRFIWIKIEIIHTLFCRLNKLFLAIHYTIFCYILDILKRYSQKVLGYIFTLTAPLYFVWLRRVDFPLPWRWPPVALPLKPSSYPQSVDNLIL